MVDNVSVQTIYEDPQRFAIKLLSLSDGTGESSVIKVDKSTLVGLNGREPSSLVVEHILANVDGMEVHLFAKHTTDISIARIGGQGTYIKEYKTIGGLQTAGAGDTGDICITTAGQSAGDSYDIVIYLRKKD